MLTVLGKSFSESCLGVVEAEILELALAALNEIALIRP